MGYTPTTRQRRASSASRGRDAPLLTLREPHVRRFVCVLSALRDISACRPILAGDGDVHGFLATHGTGGMDAFDVAERLLANPA